MKLAVVFLWNIYIKFVEQETNQELRMVSLELVIFMYIIYVEDSFCSLIIIFIIVVPCLHKHLGTGEWIYGR